MQNFVQTNLFEYLTGISFKDRDYKEIDRWIKQNKKFCQKYYSRFVEENKVKNLSNEVKEIQTKIKYFYNNIGCNPKDSTSTGELIQKAKSQNQIDISLSVELIFRDDNFNTTNSIKNISKINTGNHIHDQLLISLVKAKRALFREINYLEKTKQQSQAQYQNKRNTATTATTTTTTTTATKSQSVYDSFDEKLLNEIILKYIVIENFYEGNISKSLEEFTKEKLMEFGYKSKMSKHKQDIQNIYTGMKNILLDKKLI